MTDRTTLPTGLLTLFISDLQGSTLLLQSLGDEYPAVLSRHTQIIEEAIANNGGYKVSTHGDEVFGVFTSSRAAVEAAAATQQALNTEIWPRDVEIRVRIGLHTGEPRLHDDDYVGLDVHRAARISSAGSGGQVLLSKETAEDLAPLGVPDGIALRDIGAHRLKDLRYPELLFDLVIDGLTDDFPPLSSLGGRPNNLQVDSTTFVGRSTDIVELHRLVSSNDTRLVTLTGIGGTGKTRLALAVGGRLLDSFRDGVFRISLASLREPELVLSTIAQTLGVPEFPGISALDTLRNRLASSDMLLILDNFEQVISAAPRIGELIASCEHLKVMVTSREALRIGGEITYPVSPMTFPVEGEDLPLDDLRRFDSVELFVSRVQDLQPEFELSSDNADAIRDICAWLEGLPLAIELAASRTVLLPPNALLERLRQRADILTAGRRDADARHQTIAKMIEWSYDLLSEPERRLFETLSVFAGDFTVESATEICATNGMSDLDVLDGLQSLTAKSLLRAQTVHGEPRLRMLELIRTYAAHQLDASAGAELFRQRHAMHYADLLDTITPELQGRGQKPYLVILLDDADNFRAALHWALEQPDASLTGRILSSLQWFWIQRGWFTEALEWTERAVEEAEHLDDVRERALIHDVTGWVKIFSGDYGGALGHCQHSLDLFDTLGNESDIARTKMTLGITGAVTGQIEAGPQLIMESLAMYQGLEDRRGTALALIALGEGARAGGDTAAAEECYQAALGIVIGLGDVYWQTAMLHNLAHFRLHDGNWKEAFDLAAEALRLGEEFGYPMVVNLAIAALGGVAIARGDATLAARLFGVTDNLVNELGAVFEPLDLAELEKNTAAAKELLSPDAYAAAFADGQAWSMNQAVTAALGKG